MPCFGSGEKRAWQCARLCRRRRLWAKTALSAGQIVRDPIARRGRNVGHCRQGGRKRPDFRTWEDPMNRRVPRGTLLAATLALVATTAIAQQQDTPAQAPAPAATPAPAPAATPA